MENKLSLDDISIRNSIRPGDFGYIIHRHGKIYGDEYNYGVSFETYVGSGLHEFYQNYNPERDRVWICEHQNKIIGFLLLMHRGGETAQLRYFYLEKEYRGIGLGKKLIQLFMEFFHQKKYKSAYLWTTNELHAAAAIYKKYGFCLTESKPSNAFGKQLKEQRYDMNVEK